MKKPDYLLQNEIPNNSWLIKDTNEKIIRSVSKQIKDPTRLNEEETLIMNKLIDFVTYSQDEKWNKSTNADFLRPAVGLAAPQIGENIDMFYIRIQWPEEIEEYAMINCKLTAFSEQIMAIEGGEGCLSVDVDQPGLVKRYYKINVQGYNWLTKCYVELTLRAYPAIVFQHEMDHNIGKLYYDSIEIKPDEETPKDWMLI